MQMPGSARFAVRSVSPTRMVKLFMSRHAPGVRMPTAAAAQGGGAATAAAPAIPAADLVTWVESSGGSMSGVAVRRDEAGFGLQAAHDLSTGSMLISLPHCCHLTYDGSTDPRLLALIDQVPEKLWGAKLALQVVAHRLQGGASTFAPYINNLPLGVAGLPMFFGGEALEALQYPPVTEQVKKRCRWLLGFSQQVLAPIRGSEADPFGGAEVDANALGWALAVVTSRAFRTRGPSQPAAMLPLIDMANHSFQPNARIVPGPSGSMCMVTTRRLQAGEPVLISYGSLANDFLLMDYGFLIPGNPHDTVQLRFDRGLIEAAKAMAGVGSTSGAVDDGIGEELPALPAWQHQALVKLQLAGPGANTEVTIRRQSPPAGSSSSSKMSAAEGPVEPRLLAGVRVLCASNAAALGGKAATAEQLGGWGIPVAAAAELAALRTLTGLCAIALSQFQGTLEDDAALLAGTGTVASAAVGASEQRTVRVQAQRPLSEDEQLAVRFRMDKKQLLLEALSTISRRIKELAAAAGSGSGGSRSSTAGSRHAAGSSGSGGKGNVRATEKKYLGFGK